jgi:hypothetical protein
VIYRNGDEAGIGDYVEQNFHPKRHLLSLLRQSSFSNSPPSGNPAGIRRCQRGVHAFTSRNFVKQLLARGFVPTLS